MSRYTFTSFNVASKAQNIREGVVARTSNTRTYPQFSVGLSSLCYCFFSATLARCSCTSTNKCDPTSTCTVEMPTDQDQGCVEAGVSCKTHWDSSLYQPKTLAGCRQLLQRERNPAQGVEQQTSFGKLHLRHPSDMSLHGESC